MRGGDIVNELNFEIYISILWKKSVKSYLQIKKVYGFREKNILLYSKFLLLWKTTVRMLYNYSGAYNSILNEQVKSTRQISWSRALTLKKIALFASMKAL